MSDIHWANAVDGLFTDGANWVGGVVPGGGDTAYLDATGSDYTVTDTMSLDLGGLNIASNAILDITHVGGLGPIVMCLAINNSGVLRVHEGALIVGENFVNQGVLDLNHGNMSTAGLSLSGGGTLKFDGGKDLIRGIGGKGNVFENIDNTIVTSTGDGIISGGQKFTNEAAGTVKQTGSNTISINTGHQTVVNDGLFTSTGTGGFTIVNALENDGTIKSVGGRIIVEGKVTGTGTVVIDGGSVVFKTAFSETVSFGASGTLLLSQSPGFKATITGFSSGASLDLTDIGFVSAGEATYKGNSTGGTLTVTDGVHSAHIALSGDYLGATFTAASDNGGGVLVTETSAAMTHRFLAAAATLRPEPSSSAVVADVHELRAPLLARPHVQAA